MKTNDRFNHFYDFPSDSFYSERFMSRPGIDGNFKGYEESDVIHRAKNFRPTDSTMRRLFLVHGTRDDNVHLQHSMVLAQALVKEGIKFKQQVINFSSFIVKLCVFRTLVN